MAILSESKYGFSCQGDVLRISLLCAATAPDAEQDQGRWRGARKGVVGLTVIVFRETRVFVGRATASGALPRVGRPHRRVPLQLAFARYVADTRRFIARAGPDVTAVRAIPAGSGDAAPPPRPLALAGAHNVILETLKRGDLDSDAAGRRTVVLRLYEAYGGHARADLRVAGTLPVVAAYATNLLEDDAGAEPLEFVRAPGDNAAEGTAADYVVPLEFRGFEVKTVKLVLARQG